MFKNNIFLNLGKTTMLITILCKSKKTGRINALDDISDE